MGAVLFVKMKKKGKPEVNKPESPTENSEMASIKQVCPWVQCLEAKVIQIQAKEWEQEIIFYCD